MNEAVARGEGEADAPAAAGLPDDEHADSSATATPVTQIILMALMRASISGQRLTRTADTGS